MITATQETVKVVESPAEQYQTILIPLSDVYSDDDFNCRGPIAPIDVAELAQDIQLNGLQFPITVQPSEDVDHEIPCPWRIIAGHRRYKAFEVLGRDGKEFWLIPAMVRRGLSEIQARVLNLGENIKRKDLNILQEAKALEKLYEAGVPRDHVAKLLSKSSGWVQNRYALLSLPEDIQQECANGIINQQQIKQLYSLRHDPLKQYEAVKLIKAARARGQKIKHVGKRKKTSTNTKKARGRNECFDMIEIVVPAVGYGIHTRALAWAAGEITTEEFFDCLEEENPEWLKPQQF